MYFLHSRKHGDNTSVGSRDSDKVGGQKDCRFGYVSWPGEHGAILVPCQ